MGDHTSGSKAASEAEAPDIVSSSGRYVAQSETRELIDPEPVLEDIASNIGRSSLGPPPPDPSTVHQSSLSFNMSGMARALPTNPGIVYPVARSDVIPSNSYMVGPSARDVAQWQARGRGIPYHGANFPAEAELQSYPYPKYNLMPTVAPYYGQYQHHQQPPQYQSYPISYGSTRALSPSPDAGLQGSFLSQQREYIPSERRSHPTSPTFYNPPRTRSINVDTTSSRPEHAGSSGSNVPRGPPRKPRQSGHALWVGNLPPGATVIDLKDHFSREATNDIESVKLISKSNCGFVNYRSQAACAAALNRFNDSRFHGTRLVCRLRRTSTTTGIAPENSPDSPVTESAETPSEGNATTTADDVESLPIEQDQSIPKVPEKFIILKSLTLQDLETSTRTGTWATQVHNEAVLNRVFKSCRCLYLIFSANKSGEYFGYAKMLTEIVGAGTGDSTSQLSLAGASSSTAAAFGSSSQRLHSSTGPRAIRTPATEWAPTGIVIDDSARGTIFWEANVDNESMLSTPEDAKPLETGSIDNPTPEGSLDLASAAGHSFRIQWISTRRVPFSRTRDLRNPWNGNREVKIARDGTEIETGTGRKLLRLFGE